MQQLQKYHFQQDKPLGQPYSQDGIYNAYYEGFQLSSNKQVLISQFREPRYQRLITKHKRLQKLKNIKHQNLAQIYNIILDKANKKLFVVLEWCHGGNLYSYQKSSTLDCDTATKIIMNLVTSLNQIHKAEEMHRYINMQNVQFDINGTPKLTYRCLYPKTFYLSPQDKQGNKSKEGDLFSLGVLFYKILLAQTPFKGNSLDQQIRSVQEGPKFPRDETQMFPISLPIQIKNIIIGMTMFKSQQRMSNDKVIQQCKSFLLKFNRFALEKIELSKSPFNKIFNEQNIPIFTKYFSQQQHIIISLNSQKHELNKFHIIKSKSKQSLNKYIQQVLQPFRQVKNQIQIVPIYQNYIIEQEYLVIRTFYDNQGSLKFYLDKSGKIPLDKAPIFIEKLLQKLKKYGKTHNHLANQNILIKGGAFYISYPPFMTKQYLNKLKNSKDQVNFIAPEIKDGKNSDNADAWSVSMLKYMIQNQQVPAFDKNGKVLLKNKSNLTKDEIDFYENSLVKNHLLRRKLFQEPKQQSIQIPQIVQLKDINIQKPEKTKIKSQKTFGQFLSQKLCIFRFLQKHWTKPIRVGLKCLIGLVLLIFLFYWNFFIINGQLITEHNIYEKKIVDIRAFPQDSDPQIEYTLVTKTPIQSYTFFYNKTLSVLRDQYRCVLNDYSVESNVVEVINTSNFTAYQIFGILFSITNLIVFCLSLSKMDFPKIFNISNFQQNSFNEVWNWMFINMALASQISIIYLIYGSLFHMLLEPCLSKATLTGVQFLMKKWYFSFNIRFIWEYLGLVFSYIVVSFLIIKPKFVAHKSLKLGLVCLYLAGVFSRIMGGSGGHVAWQKQSVFGKLGELLLLIISVIFLIIDVAFGCLIKNQFSTQKITKNKINDDSMHQDLYTTQQNILPQ